MTTVVFTLPDGTTETVAGESGRSIMETAIHNNIDGIEAECGGSCACATCHVYVDPDHLAALDAVDDIENEMLEETVAVRKSNSRLSCQLILSDDIDSVAVTIPEAQV